MNRLAHVGAISRRLLWSALIAGMLICPIAASAAEPGLRLAGRDSSYVIQPGDGLYGIARRCGVSYPALARASGIENPNLIRVGKALTLPTRFIVPASLASGIVVNIPECRLYLLRGGEVTAVFPCAVGLPTWQTARGEFTIVNRVENPAWTMPPEMAERQNVQREIIPAGPENPLGDFWIGTSLAHTGIHGTNVPMSIGRALSHGCMRLYPEHIDSLFKLVAVGDSGLIVYEPVKVTLDGDAVLLEVHPDVYELTPDLARLAEERLKALGVWERVDRERLSEAIGEARGVPVPIAR
jgi:L,D-transpeptidase ErfK/SrfK